MIVSGLRTLLSKSSTVITLTRPCLSTSAITDYRITVDGLVDERNKRTTLHFESRHSCKCSACWNKHSNQIKKEFTDPSVRLTGITGLTDDFLDVEWSDGHQGQLALTGIGIYGHETPDEDHYLTTLRRASHQKYWTGGDDNQEVRRTFDWNEVLQKDENIRQFLLHFMVYGIAFLKNIPPGTNITEIVEKHLECGPLWHTIFGQSSEVKSVANPTNEAYNNDYLPVHIDLPYYTQPPSAYFFLCLKNGCKGGESMWVDTFSILNTMRVEKPEYFDILCNTKVCFRAFSPGLHKVHVVGSYPTVELSDSGELYRVRDLFFVRDNYRNVQDQEVESRRKWWTAYSHYRTRANNPDNQLIRKLGDNEMVIIDNWRVMHGRLRFENEGDNERLMEVAYGDWNHLQSRILHHTN